MAAPVQTLPTATMSTTTTTTRTTVQILLAYLFFGGLHELSHWLCAFFLGVLDLSRIKELSTERLVLLCWQALFGRQASIGEFMVEEETAAVTNWIRHTGWIMSCSVAVVLHCYYVAHKPQTKAKPWRQVLVHTAYVTALEALATDLFQFTPSTVAVTATATATGIYYCGNFGLILLNPKWWQATEERGNCHSALTILQDMIRVTMMRGAQAGGVVTFEPQHNSSIGTMKAIRSRVVNRKRTDLSQGIIQKVQSDNRRNFRTNASTSTSTTPNAMTFSGHTRFATSSIADFGGTHPHQWSPRTNKRVYDFQTAKANVVGVENYIMHNGDFEFYELDGTTYDMETIQEFLEDVLCQPMPSATDSCAIAGMVDILRTKGCFSLSVRYALALGMSGCDMGNNSTLDLPKSLEGYEKFGVVFEQALEQLIREQMSASGPPAKALAAIADDETLRDDLVNIVVPLLQQQYESLIRPLVPFHISASSNLDGGENGDEETGANKDSNSLASFARVTIDAFFDNDLLQTTKEFLANAHGSFGLCVTSSLDASSQMCLAARGQTISIAFYPKSGVILYGSEQAAVKAALNTATPGGNLQATVHYTKTNIDNPLDRCSARLDLDDLGGEICLLDWNKDGIASQDNFVSLPNRCLPVHTIMNNTVRLVLFQQNGPSQPSKDKSLFSRMTLLEGNQFIEPLKDEAKDIVLSDIQSIPKICLKIQEDWQNGSDGISFNRLTALALSRSLIRRLDSIHSGRLQRHPGSIDILLTGCEVSLWLAEQMASDLQKAFTKLNVMAVSSNKVLGLFGQEQSIPSIGFPISRQSHVLTDSIVIIVSHSGGTFGPLQCSNLLQSATRNIYAVTSEWDCQVGKQLRSMYDEHESIADSSRLFTTGVGLAPAEPCSISVAATQQLLTNIFEHMCIVAISNPRYRHISGAVITERDLQILERLNRDNIQALEAIVGADANGKPFTIESLLGTVNDLRAVGDRWAEHVLENAKAYIMSFLYIALTVTTGYPLISGIIGVAAGADRYEGLMYFLRFLDSLLYFWLPQINITILRLVQGRDLLHRMTGRTVVIGDIPWVAQSAEAFLSKLFACSYSIAGLNVHSANPADHLVHRHTHRVVRGTLLVCGRPDGRLMSLTSAESSVLLSVNQASSIQSWGGRCESVTIGHNPFSSPLCFSDVFLQRFRPLFLCERALDMTASPGPNIPKESSSALSRILSQGGAFGSLPKVSSVGSFKTLQTATEVEDMSGSMQSQSSQNNGPKKPLSSAALMGKYSTLNNESRRGLTKQSGRPMKDSSRRDSSRLETVSFFERIMATAGDVDAISTASRHGKHIIPNTSRHGSGFILDGSRHGGTRQSRHKKRDSRGSSEDILGPTVLPSHANDTHVEDVLAEMEVSFAETELAQRVFNEYDSDCNGTLNRAEFLAAYKFIDAKLTASEAEHLFEEANLTDSGELSFAEFFRVLTSPHLKLQAAKNRTIRDHVGLVSIQPSVGRYFDDDIYRKDIAGVSKIALAKSEGLSMELYEARIASLQRFVSMTVMFHQLGYRVQTFFRTISFGLWGYRMDRTHSIMRVATTASPASGAHVRKQMEVLRVFHILSRAANTIAGAWARYKARKIELLLEGSSAGNQEKVVVDV